MSGVRRSWSRRCLGEVSEDSNDEEDEVEEMWIVQDLLTSVCALEARLCEVEARLGEVGRGRASRAPTAVSGRCVRDCDEH